MCQIQTQASTAAASKPPPGVTWIAQVDGYFQSTVSLAMVGIGENFGREGFSMGLAMALASEIGFCFSNMDHNR
jgi:hypothetical protein